MVQVTFKHQFKPEGERQPNRWLTHTDYTAVLVSPSYLQYLLGLCLPLMPQPLFLRHKLLIDEEAFRLPFLRDGHMLNVDGNFKHNKLLISFTSTHRRGRGRGSQAIRRWRNITFCNDPRTFFHQMLLKFYSFFNGHEIPSGNNSRWQF
jgi:hypothetical protein